MKYLNIDVSELKVKGGFDTAKEISGQPGLWETIYAKLVAEQNEIDSFLESTLKRAKKIILTGAGTSAYIGYSVEGAMQRKTGITTVSIATTHLVSHPQDYFEPNTPTLMISFARSGNSPESVAAVRLADEYINECYHLVITCNEDGDLAKFAQKDKNYVFLLPPESNDKSLAMTGSYTGMLLSALLLSDFDHIRAMKGAIGVLVDYGRQILFEQLETIMEIGRLPFKRAVFLGSGPQYGTAMESNLKLQELTDGSIICKNDSYLGFRHGPKAVVDEETLLVYYFSNNESVLRYEIDLVNGMEEGKKPLRQIGVATKQLQDLKIDDLMVLGTSGQSEGIEEQYLAVATILVGQMIGFFKSWNLGLCPDSPSTTGAISRIVKGVKIY